MDERGCAGDGVKRRRQRGDECGRGGDVGDIEDGRARMNIDVTEIGVKQKTTERG